MITTIRPIPLHYVAIL